MPGTAGTGPGPAALPFDIEGGIAPLGPLTRGPLWTPANPGYQNRVPRIARARPVPGITGDGARPAPVSRSTRTRGPLNIYHPPIPGAACEPSSQGIA